MDFRARLREEIEFAGLSNKELAAKAGVTKRAVDSYVSSQACMPSADVAVRLAKALNTTVEYLVTGDMPAPSSDKAAEGARKLLHVYAALPENRQALLLAVADDIVTCLK